MSVWIRLAVVLACAHVLALCLGLFGLLSAVPNVAQFQDNAYAIGFYNWAIVNTGTIDILTAASAMLAYGFGTIGLRRTATFFVAAVVISATAELTGTKTGWPFGGYEYTGFLGFKLAGRVPYTVPLSWFYMGFASFLLARGIAGSSARATPVAIVLGAWLLMAWDLVLDPALASAKMSAMHFWIWKEHGAYFGMPLRNLVGWLATGLLFITAGRLSWGRDVAERALVRLPFAIYAANIVWAMALSVSVGLWPTAIAAVILSLLPAALALRVRVATPVAAPAAATG